MDPVVELATLVVSYVWPWRELFPEHPTLPAAGEITAEKLVERIGEDIAQYLRLHELAARGPLNSWQEAGAARTWFAPPAASDIESVLRKAARPRQTESRFADALNWCRDQFGSLSATEIMAARAGLVTGYVAHLRELVGTLRREYPDIATAKDVPVMRDALACYLSRVLLARGVESKRRLAVHVAEALDYRPVLLRAFPDRTHDAGYLDDERYPRQLIDRCHKDNLPLPFSFVLHEELDEIERSRRERCVVPAATAGDLLSTDRAVHMGLTGLAFSGGGIRSATFNLGVLQALANKDWLRQIDYLSTVSGGGYIGGWLVAWIKRRGSIDSVAESLRGPVGASGEQVGDPYTNIEPSAEHVSPIRFLREYSNYLAPKAGFFSTDSWTMLSIWVRNTLLNLIVLALFLMALLIAPRALGLGLLHLTSPTVSSFWAIVLLLAASWRIGRNLAAFDETVPSGGDAPQTRGDSAFVITTTLVLPLAAMAFLATAALWGSTPYTPQENPLLTGIPAVRQTLRSFISDPFFYRSFLACFFGLFIAAFVANLGLRGARGALALEQDFVQRLRVSLGASARSLGSTLVAAGVGGLAAMLLSRAVMPILWEDTQRGVWLAVAFGPLTIFVSLSAVIVLYVGLEGRRFPDERREWWSRLGALIGLAGTGWALVSCVSFFAPLWLAYLQLYGATLGLGWGTITALGSYLASRGESNGKNLALDRNVFSNAVIKMAPFVFVLGFLVLLSVVAHVMLGALQAQRLFVGPDFTLFERLPFDFQRYTATYWAMLEPRSWAPVLVALTLCVGAYALAWRVDVNEFSMHHFYRNRLVRAYLGASRTRRHRRPNAFTGFDLADDIELWRLTFGDRPSSNDAATDCRRGYTGPYPLINTTLNVTAGEDLAWQERKGQSFIFSPLYCGYDFSAQHAAAPDELKEQFAYRPTKFYASGLRPGVIRKDGDRAPGTPVSLGTGIAISGAAASPNSGHHSSPGVAFLLTVFNARLGWWMGNPRLKSWSKSSPHHGLFYLLSELFGFANTNRKYVNLSDGGHFDNTGLYELVRRRCRYIIVCDAEQDYSYSMAGLANAVRKCRVDFGAIITFNGLDKVKPNPDTKMSEKHFCIGTIRYAGIAEPGTLVYLKSSVAGQDEPPDVLEYRQRFPMFPHQSTGDQFFDESQFESYRALGQHIGEQIDAPWNPSKPGGEVV